MIVSVEKVWWGRTGSEDEKARREYREVYLVRTDSLEDGPATVNSAPGLPRRWVTTYRDPNGESDSGAYATSISGTQDSDDGFQWTVIVTYTSGSESTRDRPERGIKDPLERPIEIEGDFVTFQKPLTAWYQQVVFKGSFGPGQTDFTVGGQTGGSPLDFKKASGAPSDGNWLIYDAKGLQKQPLSIVRVISNVVTLRGLGRVFKDPVLLSQDLRPVANSAADKISPPPEVDHAHPLVRIVRNLPSWDPAISILYANAINADPFRGGAPGQVKCQSIKYKSAFENNLYFVVVTYEFLGNEDGWGVTLLDAGLRCVKAFGVQRFKIMDPDMKTAVSSDVTLDGSGHELAGGDQPCFRRGLPPGKKIIPFAPLGVS